MKKAVLFLIFNRFDTTQKVFEQIKKAKPQRLYVSSDGWRNSKAGEEEQVKEIRKWVLDNIDWDCEVKTNFSEKNKGCDKSISEAITWFFSFEKDGIILEDDCVPAQSFFSFCEELLDKYKDDKKIWNIAGFLVYQDKNLKESYYFTKLLHCWGWATWADRWKYFKFELTDYDEKMIDDYFEYPNAIEYWRWIFREVNANRITAWDYKWFYTMIKHQGLSISANKTLVSNIGYVGVHYQYNSENCIDKNLGKQLEEIDEIVHPDKVELNRKAVDYELSRFILPPPPPSRVKYNNGFERLWSVKSLGGRKIITIFGFQIKIKISQIREIKKILFGITKESQ